MSSSSKKLSSAAQKTARVLQEDYGFSAERSLEAVNAISNKGDVQAAYNWLLDHGEEDKGGAVDFIICDHLTPPVEKRLISKTSLKYGAPCLECSHNGENWLCLFCGETHCSRYAQGHALSHHQKTKAEEEATTHVSSIMFGASLPLGHFLAISLMDLSVWCYECQAYVTHSSLHPLVRQMEELKFGEPSKKKQKNEENSIEEEEEIGEKVGVPMKVSDWTLMHGFLGDRQWDSPLTVSDSRELARPGYKSMSASEYFDSPAVLDAKVKLLAVMIKNSRNFVSYTGAGISTASGIPDYASKSSSIMQNEMNKSDPLSAPPTLSHIVLTNLHFAGYLKHWVQQNHDGLPQKAGYPQKHLNEIHGGWFDPSNPVVPMSGTLRDDEIKSLLEWEGKADLCVAMGTTMCGMNSDRIFHSCAKSAFHTFRTGKVLDPAVVLGGVIINLQQTQYDSLASLRIFAKIDDVMSRLADFLQISVTPISLPLPETEEENVYQNLPYNRNGKFDPSSKLTLDLRPGSLVRLIRQPQWDIDRKGNVATVLGRTQEGHYIVDLDGKVKRNFGVWWLRDAQKGNVDWLPLVNA